VVEEPAGLDEETLAHFEHTPEFITTCLIVNEPPHFLQILAIVCDLLHRFFKSATRNLEELGAQNRPRVSLGDPGLSSVVPSGQYFLEGN
jgi:hypothetical protein